MRHRFSSREALAILAFIVVAAMLGARVVRNLEVPGHPELPYYAMQDFRDEIYYPTRTLLAGDNPYLPSAVRRHYVPGSLFALYTPITFLVHLPLALLPQRPAELADFVLNLAATLALAWTALRICGIAPRRAAVFGLAAAVLLSRPGHMNLYVGECAAYVTVASYLALYFARTQPPLAGAALAVACVKPTFAAPLVLVLLARGARRAVVTGLTLALVLSVAVAPFIIGAAGGIGALIESLRENYAEWVVLPQLEFATSLQSIDASAFVGRLLRSGMAPRLQLAVGVLVLGAGTFAVARLYARDDVRTTVLAHAIACLTILAGVHHQVYDGVLLTLPAVAVATGTADAAARPLDSRLRAVLVGLLVVPGVNYVATDFGVRFLDVSGAVWMVVASVNGAALILAFGGMLLVARDALRAEPYVTPSLPLPRRASATGWRS